MISTHTLFPLGEDAQEKKIKGISSCPLILIEPSAYIAGKSWRFGWRSFGIAPGPAIEALTLASSSVISSTK